MLFSGLQVSVAIMSPAVDELLHVGGQGCREVHFAPGAGMAEAQGAGMEGLTGAERKAVAHKCGVGSSGRAAQNLRAAVALVAEKGMP